MSIYDKASLVLIPSGTKTSKVYSQVPTNGDGDFTFSRSTAATRVNASGNIEKETQNLLLQSVNMTSSSWTQQSQGTRVLATDPLGGNTAVTLNDTDPVGYYRIESSQYGVSGVITASVYVKKTTGALSKYAGFDIAAINNYVIFDTTNGTYNLTGPSSDYIDVNVVSYDANWWRVSMTGVVSSSNVFRMWPAISFDGSGIGASAQGVNTFWAPQVEQGLVARDYIETTTTAIYGGITDNVPRLDYTDSSCPALLLEPQRTNLLHYSSPAPLTTSTGALDQWVIYSATTGVVNDAIGVDGYQTATKYTNASNASSDYMLYRDLGVVAGQTYTCSGYLKLGTATNACVVINDFTAWNTLPDAHFVATAAAGYDEWKRFEITFTAPNTNRINIHIGYHNETNPDAQSLGTFYLDSFQVEQGSYATSYIPTYGSAVTRNGEGCNKTGISSLIGQTEGTMFIEFDYKINSGNMRFSLSDNSGVNWIFIATPESGTSNASRFYIRANNVVQVDKGASSYFTLNERYKLALAYKSGDWAIYGNGTLLYSGTDTFDSFTLPLQQVNFIQANGGTAGEKLPINQSLVFKTRLSNEELATLTTI